MSTTHLFLGAAIGLALCGVVSCSAIQPGIQLARISIPPGMRAVSVRAFGRGTVGPGMHVDVLVTDNASEHDRTVLQNVEVAAYEQQKPESVGVVTVLTSPTDAEKLTLAAQKGRIEVSPRR
jgi:Flp pilus assembly protein CpaB